METAAAEEPAHGSEEEAGAGAVDTGAAEEPPHGADEPPYAGRLEPANAAGARPATTATLLKTPIVCCVCVQCRLQVWISFGDAGIGFWRQELSRTQINE